MSIGAWILIYMISLTLGSVIGHWLRRARKLQVRPPQSRAPYEQMLGRTAARPELHVVRDQPLDISEAQRRRGP